MPTPFDAIHVRLSRRDLDELADGVVLVMDPRGEREKTVVVDAAPSPNDSKTEVGDDG